MEFEYLFTLLLLLLIAFIIKWKLKITVFRSLKEVLVFYFIVFIIGTIWDNFAVWKGIWNYPGKGIVGLFIGLIPIEDYVFAIITSFTVLVFYKAIQKHIK